MKTDPYPVGIILGEAIRFLVPIYQRKYQWEDSQLDPFWEDVHAKAIEVLRGRSKFHHYMGALILSPIGEAGAIGVTRRVQVVDGQQRLTTFQLFLAAIREVAQKHGCDEVRNKVNDYLFTQPKSMDKDEFAEFKLTPTRSDQAVFFDIMKEDYSTIRSRYEKYYWHGRVPKKTEFPALRAYQQFYKLIDWFAKFGSDEAMIDSDDGSETATVEDETDTAHAIRLRLDAILDALLNRIKLVVITLEDDDDAQVIFETLNSKGKPLLAMDLVRNNIFYRAEREREKVEDLYWKRWDPFDDSWWREVAPSARPRRSRIDHFLSHVLAAETGQSISMRELYAEYRDFAVPKGKLRFRSVDDELRILEKYSPAYETLERRREEDVDLHWFGEKLSAWQVTTAYPIAMQISTSCLHDDAKRMLYRLIYSYIVRRALSGLTAKNLNRVFQGISQVFLKNGPSVQALKGYFSDKDGPSTRFPEDEEFCRGIGANAAYEIAPQTRIRDVLRELERASRPRFGEMFGDPGKLWTEHVLPIEWTSDWPFEEGDFVSKQSGHPRAEKRNHQLHTLGNLTLLGDDLNRSTANKGFLEKREKYKKHSKLCLNDWFRGKNSWYEADIRERGKALAAKAVEIWPPLNGGEYVPEQAGNTSRTARDTAATL